MRDKKKVRVYIRRLHARDKAADFRTAGCMAANEILGTRYYYAIVQCGHRHRVLAVGTSKLDLKRRVPKFWRKRGRKYQKVWYRRKKKVHEC